MVDWILVMIILTGNEPRVEHIRFKDELACLAAASRVRDAVEGAVEIRTICAVDGESDDIKNDVR